ncbi:hypothetical protein LCGC14_0467240 [marine sediment metagenome]|uniref:Glycosyltransferase family 9 (Heptosyltransferase) n=1 Tax=marine sediment metagenome TaxID=412755 RepID=A0A0F9V049_9ZZZZ
MAKRILITRLGAIGDMIMITPLLRLLKEEGNHITLNCKGYSKTVLKYNPYIDKYIVHDESIPIEKLDEHLDELAKGYDEHINLTASIENGLLVTSYQEEFGWPHDKRHEKCDRNYYDETLRLGGRGETGLNGELFFSAVERLRARDEMKKYKGKFVILWSLSGSSHHKSWPMAEQAARAFLDAYDDAVIITVGDDVCRLLEWDHPRTIQRSGKWQLRKSLIMTKYADLVIGTETGILNAAGCFSTPKVILLSHSSSENLSRHWRNCTSIEPDVECHPCHKLHFSLSTCVLDKGTNTPLCMTSVAPATVLNAIQNYYDQWRYYHGRRAA